MNESKSKRFMDPLLRQWYGKERGEGEMVRYTPESVPIRTALEHISERLIPPWELRVTQLKDTWNTIAGPENARRCRPSGLRDGILYIEVFHPIYRNILETPQIKQGLLEKIRDFIGQEHCKTIKFIVGGRTPMR